MYACLESARQACFHMKMCGPEHFHIESSPGWLTRKSPKHHDRSGVTTATGTKSYRRRDTKHASRAKSASSTKPGMSCLSRTAFAHVANGMRLRRLERPMVRASGRAARRRLHEAIGRRISGFFGAIAVGGGVVRGRTNYTGFPLFLCRVLTSRHSAKWRCVISRERVSRQLPKAKCTANGFKRRKG
jgi:hypothetical protein